MKKKLLSLLLALCMILSTAVTLGVTTFAEGEDEPATDPEAATLTEADITAAVANNGTITLNTFEDLKLLSSMNLNKVTFTILLGADIVVNENFDPDPATWPQDDPTTTEVNERDAYIAGLKQVDSYIVNEFYGLFNGQGNTIEGLYITSGALFNHILNASDVTLKNCYSTMTSTATQYVSVLANCTRPDSVMENITVENCYITATNNANGYVGGVTGRVLGALTVRNCSVSGKITMTYGSTSVGSYVGGIVGGVENTNTITISDCVNTATVTGIASVGGIVGKIPQNATVTVENCVNGGAVSVDGSKNTSINAAAGGIVGYNVGTTTIRGCINEGAIAGKNCESVGGIVGSATQKITIQNCVNKEAITGDKAQRLAGIAARLVNGTSVEGCVNFGDITSTNVPDGVQRTGGILGDIHNKFSMKTCANFGDIAVSLETITNGGVGGLTGYGSYNSDVVDCLSAGDVTAANRVSGVIGHVQNSSTANYKNIIVTGTISAGNTTADLNTFWGASLMSGNIQNNYFAGVQQYKLAAATEWTAFTAVKDGFTSVSADALKGVAGYNTLTAAGYDFATVWSMTNDLPVPTKLAKATPDAAAEIVYKGYQLGINEDAGKIRFIAGMDEIDGYTATGFDIVITTTEGSFAPEKPLSTTTVYESLKADGNADAIKASDLGCSYLSALTLTDMPTDCVITLTATLTPVEGEVVSGTAVVIVVQNGAVVAQYVA